MVFDTEYTIEISLDGLRWREMPLGYRQDGTILSNDGDVVTQSIGRGNVVSYRAVPIAAAGLGTARG